MDKDDEGTDAKRTTIPIPRGPRDIDTRWVVNAFRALDEADLGEDPADHQQTMMTLAHLRISTPTCESERFFDRCDVSVAFKASSGKGGPPSGPQEWPCSRSSADWTVLTVPREPTLRQVVLAHQLFSKEILLHQRVLPVLAQFARDRVGGQQDLIGTLVDEDGRLTLLPGLLHGDFDPRSGDGLMIFDNHLARGYAKEDPELMRLLDQGQIERVVAEMARFHALSSAYDLEHPETTLEQQFPLLSRKRNAWFRQDMSGFLQEMYRTCLEFFRAVPGQEDISSWYESRMRFLSGSGSSDAGGPKTAGAQHHPKMYSLIHGDLGHNNIYFGPQPPDPAEAGPPGQVGLVLTDWQMAHMGSATDDLCYFLLSSTTSDFRRAHWDGTLRLYFRTFCQTLEALSSSVAKVDSVAPKYEEFLDEVRHSLPISLFFCANLMDLEDTVVVDEEPQLSSLSSMATAAATSDRDPSMVPHWHRRDEHHGQGHRLARGQDQGQLRHQASFRKLHSSLCELMSPWSCEAIPEEPLRPKPPPPDLSGGIVLNFGSRFDLEHVDKETAMSSIRQATRAPFGWPFEPQEESPMVPVPPNSCASLSLQEDEEVPHDELYSSVAPPHWNSCHPRDDDAGRGRRPLAGGPDQGQLLHQASFRKLHSSLCELMSLWSCEAVLKEPLRPKPPPPDLTGGIVLNFGKRVDPEHEDEEGTAVRSIGPETWAFPERPPFEPCREPAPITAVPNNSCASLLMAPQEDEGPSQGHHGGHHPVPGMAEAMLRRGQGLAKVPTVATDVELRQVVETRDQAELTPRKARALRRKMYLDLCREALSCLDTDNR